MERVKRDHLRSERRGQDLGNVTQPRPQGNFDQTRGKVHTRLTDRESLQISNSFQWRKRQQKNNLKSQYPIRSWLWGLKRGRH